MNLVLPSVKGRFLEHAELEGNLSGIDGLYDLCAPFIIPSNDVTVYVSPTGNDANSGNSAGDAFATVARAIVALSAYMFVGGVSGIIQLLDGTYNESMMLGAVLADRPNALKLLGNIANPAAVNLRGVNGDAIRIYRSTSWNLSGFKVGGGTTVSGVKALYGTRVSISNVWFDTVTESHVYVSENAFVEHTGNYSVIGNAGLSHMYSAQHGMYLNANKTIALANNLTILRMAMAVLKGVLHAPGLVFTGGAGLTAQRFLTNLGGLLQTNGGGVNYFPGNTAGTVTSGAIYA